MNPYQLLLVPEWYQYKAFIEAHHNPECDGHIHHIVPRCLGGTDDSNNLCKLEVEHHQVAHELLARCFDEGSDAYMYNMWSARLLGHTSVPSCRTGTNNPFYGKTHSQKTKDFIAARNVELWRGVDYSNKYGDNADAEREKRRVGVMLAHQTMTDEQKQARSEKQRAKRLLTPADERKKQARKAALAGKPQISIDGVVFDCIGDACKYFGVTRYFLKKTYTIEEIK